MTWRAWLRQRFDWHRAELTPNNERRQARRRAYDVKYGMCPHGTHPADQCRDEELSGSGSTLPVWREWGWLAVDVETVTLPVALLRGWSDELYLDETAAGNVAERIDAALGERAGAPTMTVDEGARQ